VTAATPKRISGPIVAIALVLAITGAIAFAIYRSLTVRWPTGDVLAFRAVDGERALVLREGQDGVFAADLVLEDRTTGPQWRKGIYGLQARDGSPLLSASDDVVLVRATDAEGSAETHLFGLEDGDFRGRRATGEAATEISGAHSSSSCVLPTGTLHIDEQGALRRVPRTAREDHEPGVPATRPDEHSPMRCIQSGDPAGTILMVTDRELIFARTAGPTIRWRRSLARLRSAHVLHTETGFYLHAMGDSGALLLRIDAESGEPTAAATMDLQHPTHHWLHRTHFHGDRLWVGNAAGVRVIDATTLRPLHSAAVAPRLTDAEATLDQQLPVL